MTKTNASNPKTQTFAIALTTLLVVLVSGCNWDSGTFNQQAFGPCINAVTPITQKLPMDLIVNHLGGGASEIAQSFEQNSDYNVAAVSLFLHHMILPGNSAPPITGKLTAVLDLDYTPTDSPADRELARASIDVTQVTAAGGTYDFVFPKAVLLRAHNRYWIRLQADYTPNSTDFIAWRGDQDNPLASGHAVFKLGSGWTNSGIPSSLDLDFTLGCSR